MTENTVNVAGPLVLLSHHLPVSLRSGVLRAWCVTEAWEVQASALFPARSKEACSYFRAPGDVCPPGFEDRSSTHNKCFKNNVNTPKTTASKEFSEIRLQFCP